MFQGGTSCRLFYLQFVLQWAEKVLWQFAKWPLKELLYLYFVSLVSSFYHSIYASHLSAALCVGASPSRVLAGAAAAGPGGGGRRGGFPTAAVSQPDGGLLRLAAGPGHAGQR